MPLSKLSKQLAAKALLAAVLLMVLASVAGSQLAPKVPLRLVLLYSVLGAAALLVALVVATVALLTLAQFILRKGGTDPQWFWFSSEPPGLEDLRSQVSDSQTKTEK